MKRLLLAFALLACWLAIPASAQQFRTSTVDPVGNCTTDVVYNTSNGKMWGCNATGTFSQVNAGSSLSGLTTNVLPKATSATTVGNSSITDNGTTVSTTEPLTALSVATGSSAPAITAGTGGVWACGEGTAPSVGFPASAVDGFYCDATTHKILASFNNDTALPITRTICAASKALATGAITSASSATDTLTCTGLATTDTVTCSFNGAYVGITGYIPSTNGTLGIGVYPTANTINITVQNNTSGSITPGAITLNCRAER